MTAPVGIGLVRLTIAAPKRRMDVALPEHVTLAELLPNIIWRAGEGVADDGERHGGWALRQVTGTLLEPGRTLAAQNVRDGEVLHLTPRRSEWPELEYDDVVEAIASGARRYGRSWSGALTRRAGLAVCASVMAVGLADLLLAGSSWALAGGLALASALILMTVGIVLSRAMADALGGAVVAGVGLPYAFVGGFLFLAPAHVGLLRLGAPHLLLGAAVLLVFGVIGYVGVAALARLFAAATVLGLLGMLAGLLGLTSLSPAAVAATTLTVAVGLLPGYPILSARIGKLPFPTLPERAEQVLEDRPVPARAEVLAAVVRTDELLTGLLLATSVVAVVGAIVLMISERVSAIVLTVVLGVALLLRARLFAIARQRIPLIAGGMLCLVSVDIAFATRAGGGVGTVVVLTACLAMGAVALVGGLLYSKRAPSPYMGRFADIIDVVAIIALIPVTCVVAGLYTQIQGMFASFG